MPEQRSFCVRVILSDHIQGRGMNRRTKSVMMFGIAVPSQKGPVLMQLFPMAWISQIAEMGLHWKMAANVCEREAISRASG